MGGYGYLQVRADHMDAPAAVRCARTPLSSVVRRSVLLQVSRLSRYSCAPVVAGAVRLVIVTSPYMLLSFIVADLIWKRRATFQSCFFLSH